MHFAESLEQSMQCSGQAAQDPDSMPYWFNFGPYPSLHLSQDVMSDEHLSQFSLQFLHSPDLVML